VSLGSILAVTALTLATIALHEPTSIITATSAVAVLIILRHRENIGRLWRGTELRLYGADVRGAHAVTETEKETE
jgi:glycerol-3-phosphate acyltransferase PlsY